MNMFSFFFFLWFRFEKFRVHQCGCDAQNKIPEKSFAHGNSIKSIRIVRQLEYIYAIEQKT